MCILLSQATRYMPLPKIPRENREQKGLICLFAFILDGNRDSERN